MQDRLTRLEETVAHLSRLNDDLSDIVARQEGEINRLSRRVAQLTQRAAQADAADGGRITLVDQKPPHW